MYLSCRYHSPKVGTQALNTQLAFWCVGATAGTTMQMVAMAAKQNQAHSTVIHSRNLVLMLLAMPLETRAPL